MKYEKENSRWIEEGETKVSNEIARLMVRKLAKHFKLPIHHIYFRRGVTSTAYKWGREIKFWNNPSIKTICHEVCHFYCWKKFDKKVQHGSKKWLSQMKIIINYVKRKNYWKEELERRTKPKEPKPEPTKQEIRLKRIQQLEERKKGYERRIRLSKNRIKKINRQVSGLKRFL